MDKQAQINLLDQRIEAAEMDVFQAQEQLAEADKFGGDVKAAQDAVDKAEALLKHRQERRNAIK